MSLINYQSEVVVTEGVKLDIGFLMFGSRTPATYTLTNTAAAAIGDEVLHLTSSADNLLIQAGTKLPFGMQSVIVTDDTVIDATTQTSLPVRPLTAAISNNATAVTLALLTVLGLTEASPSAETQDVDVTNFLSGFGQEKVTTGVNRMVQCSGIVIVGDRALDTILKPLALEDEKARREVYANLVMPSGESFKGAAKISNFNSSVGLRDVQKYSFQLMFQGLSFKHTAAVIYAPIAQDAA